MVADTEGFLQPVVDAVTCVHCGKCKTICPVLHPAQERAPLAVYVAKTRDEELRLKSSSGGMFSMLANEVLAQSGIVFGAGWKYPEMAVVHKSAECQKELEYLRGSKYVQSDIGDVHEQVAKELTTGRTVLFSGTPCQVAGVNAYLQMKFSKTQLVALRAKLLLVDLICHGAPSPKAWQAFCTEQARRKNDQLKHVSFRDKAFGWMNYSLRMEFFKSKEVLLPVQEGGGGYLRGFIGDAFLRLSCGTCSSKNLKSQSDITLADAWGSQAIYPQYNDGKGLSAVLVNTAVGQDYFKRIAETLDYADSSYAFVRQTNPSVWCSVNHHPSRGRFFVLLERGCSFREALRMAMYRPFWKRGLSFFRRCVKKVF